MKKDKLAHSMIQWNPWLNSQDTSDPDQGVEQDKCRMAEQEERHGGVLKPPERTPAPAPETTPSNGSGPQLGRGKPRGSKLMAIIARLSK